MTDNGISRRGLIRAGAAGVMAAGMTGQMVSISLAADDSQKPIEIITSSSNLTQALFGIVKEKRFLEDLGLKPTITNVADGSKVIPAIISGAVDFCTMNGVGLLFPAVEKGGKMKLLGGSSLLPQIAVYSAKPDVKSLKDLEGRVVATGALNALTHQMMVAAFKKSGVDASKVQFRNVGNNTDIFKAVVAGTVDAGPSGIDVYNQQAKYGTHVLSDGDLWTVIPDYTYQASFASDDAIAQKRDLLVRALAAFAKLHIFIQSPDSKDSFARNYQAATGDKDDVQALSAWQFIQKVKPYSMDIVLSEDRVRYFQDLNVEMGIQKSVLPFNQLADMSLARDALKLIKS